MVHYSKEKMVGLFLKICRGIILLPVAVGLMVLLQNVEPSFIDTHSTVEGVYETN